MNELSKLLQENLNIEFISATLSNPKNKDGVQKVKVRPILKKDVLYFQLESFRNNQAFHENVEEKLKDMKNIVMKYLPGDCSNELKIMVLLSIYHLHDDLRRHTYVENNILVPIVSGFERDGK